jgi:transposase
MENILIKRIDHLGLVAGVIHDLGLVKQIDGLLPYEGKITTGQAVAGMILNGLGFTDRPMSLTPEFFKEIAVSRLLFDDDIEYEDFNRHRLGRALDAIHEYGVSDLFSKVASNLALKEGIRTNTLILDTTTFSVTGEKYEDTDENVISIKRGYSKDHRPELKQVVNELLVTPDGGFPLFLKNHDGNASDSKIFGERAKALREQLIGCEGTLIGDSKLYSEENAKHLAAFKYVTRIPETIKVAKQLIAGAVKSKAWQETESGFFFQSFDLTHYDIKQTWGVYYSEEGLGRAKKTMDRQADREKEDIIKQLYHLQAQVFGCENDAADAIKKIIEHKKFNGRGRPTKDQNPEMLQYKLQVEYESKEAERQIAIMEKACFIIGTNDKTKTPQLILSEYKSQNHVELGFRFLKDPHFFTSSFFLKKPERIDALIGVMSLALLVYSVAQRRIRQSLAKTNESLVDPVYGATKRPTFRRIMQMFLGINEVMITIQDVMTKMVTGMNKFRESIVLLISDGAAKIYNMNQSSA